MQERTEQPVNPERHDPEASRVGAALNMRARKRSEFVVMFDDCVQIHRPEWLTEDQWRLAVTKINAWWDGLRHYVAYNADVEYIVNGVIVVSQYGFRPLEPRSDHLVSSNARTWTTQ